MQQQEPEHLLPPPPTNIITTGLATHVTSISVPATGLSRGLAMQQRKPEGRPPSPGTVSTTVALPSVNTREEKTLHPAIISSTAGHPAGLSQARTIWDPVYKKGGLFGGHLNVRSLVPKREQIEHLLCNSNVNFICLFIYETWLTSSSPKAVVSLQDYKTFRKDRGQGRGGGVLLYVKNNLKCNQIKWPNDITLECIGVNISLPREMSLTVICIYCKPTANIDFYDQLKALLASCNHKKEILLFIINWDDKKDRKNLMLITDYFNLTQLIEQPTRVTHCTHSRIDLVFTNKPERITTIMQSFSLETSNAQKI